MLKNLNLLFLLITLSATAAAQQPEVYINSSNGGLCSASIELLKNGTFNYESGCEASSHRAFGTWTQKKDTIKLTAADTRDFKIIKVVPSHADNSTELSVRLFDQTGKNITGRLLTRQYVAGKGYYSMESDSTNMMRTDLLRANSVIAISSLERIFADSFRVPTNGFTNFDITINIPNELVYLIRAGWIDIGNFSLLKTKEGLLSLEHYGIDDTGNAVKMLYKRYQN